MENNNLWSSAKIVGLSDKLLNLRITRKGLFLYDVLCLQSILIMQDN